MIAEPLAASDAAVDTPPGVGDEALDRALGLGLQIVGGLERLSEQLTLGRPPDLGAINLPPIVGAPEDRAHLQTVAPLYLAAELEAANLLSTVEALAGVFASGGLPLELADAGRLLHAFWQGRQHRFAPGERKAFFLRLFGAPPVAGTPSTAGANAEFEPLMVELASALASYEIRPPQAPIVGDTRVRTTARELMANLLPRSGGMALFAARDLMTTLRDAIAILKHPLVQRSVGGHGVWDTLRVASERYVHQRISLDARLTRGKSGMLILTWLAEVMSSLEDITRRPVDARHESVLAAAVSWLQASVPLYEQRPVAGAAS